MVIAFSSSLIAGIAAAATSLYCCYALIMGIFEIRNYTRTHVDSAHNARVFVCEREYDVYVGVGRQQATQRAKAEFQHPKR